MEYYKKSKCKLQFDTLIFRLLYFFFHHLVILVFFFLNLFIVCLIFLVYHFMFHIFFVSFNCISAAHMHIHVCMLMFMFCTESILQTVVCGDSVESHRNQPKVIATKRIAMPCPSMHITKTKSRLKYPLDMQNFLNSKL